jgi:hypothetical protein
MRKGSVSGRGGCSVGEGPIGLGGIEQRHPTLNALQGDGARLVQVRPTVKTDPPAADGRRGLVDLLRKAPPRYPRKPSPPPSTAAIPRSAATASSPCSKPSPRSASPGQASSTARPDTSSRARPVHPEVIPPAPCLRLMLATRGQQVRLPIKNARR